MPSIEIEYPLANAQLSLSFAAGGTYDLARLRPKFLVTDTYQIICKLWGGLPEAIIATSNPCAAPPASGSWSVMLNLPSGSSGAYASCTLRAYFLRNGQEGNVEHEVAGINASNQTGGSIEVRPIP